MTARPHTALTRTISPRIGRCELTYLERVPIDLSRARSQHAGYRAALERLGCQVIELPEVPDLPDAVFVEDTAVVLDEVAVVTRPGAASRRSELPSVESALGEFRPIARIEAPGTLDGGDVLCVGKSIYVGRTSRSDPDGAEQFRRIVEPHGYDVTLVDVRGCLHLKSAATWVGRNTVLVNPELVDPTVFAAHDVLHVDPHESGAANVVVVGDATLCSASHPRTNDRLREHGFELEVVASDELAKAEGALTCCSLLFRN